MSLSLWIQELRALWNGRQDARSAVPELQGPNPYYEYLARKGRRRASEIERRYWREDQRNKSRWIDAENQQHQAELELPRLQKEADAARAAYEMERARDQEEAVVLNPPGRAYIPPVLHWLLLALLIAGDAAISYTAFLTIGDVTPWLVGALSLMVVVAMVVIGHVIGDRFRHGLGDRWTKIGLVTVVIVISLVMTIFREQAQETAMEVTGGAKIETITIDQPPAVAPATSGQSGTGQNQPGTNQNTTPATTQNTTPATTPATAPATTPATAPAAQDEPAEPETATTTRLVFDPSQLPAFFMFLTVTMMGMVVPAILAYYVERRPRLLKSAESYRLWRWAKARLDAGRRRFYRANRRVAATRSYRTSRHTEAQARLDESRDDAYYLMAAYARANLRKRGSQELPAGLVEKPLVPGRELLAGELDWTYPEAYRGPEYWGKAPGQL